MYSLIVKLKLISFSLLLTCSLLLTACGGGESPPPNPEETTPPGQTPEPTPVPDPAPAPTPVPIPGTSVLQPSFDDSIVVYANELYVDSTAPVGGTGSQASPFNSIAQAMTIATPGTRIHIAAGTYGPIGRYNLFNHATSATAPIALVGQGNVIVDGGGILGGSDFTIGLYLSEARYIILENITFQNANFGISIDDGSSYDTPAEHIIMRNLVFRNIGGDDANNDCIKLSGVDNFYIAGSTVVDCGGSPTGSRGGEAIDMVGCHHGIITGNHFSHPGWNAVGSKGGSADILIHGNYFSNVRFRAVNAGGSTNPVYFRPLGTAYEATRIRILGNIFYRMANTQVAFTSCHDCVFANNTLIEPQGVIAMSLVENTSAGTSINSYFYNNLIVFNVSDGVRYFTIGANADPTTLYVENNLWYALDRQDYTGPSYNAGIVYANEIIQQDPILADRVGGDYRILDNNSPARRAGRDVPMGLTPDYAGNNFVTTPDIGAYAIP